jgi:hypothetical protein
LDRLPQLEYAELRILADQNQEKTLDSGAHQPCRRNSTTSQSRNGVDEIAAGVTEYPQVDNPATTKTDITHAPTLKLRFPQLCICIFCCDLPAVKACGPVSARSSACSSRVWQEIMLRRAPLQQRQTMP